VSCSPLARSKTIREALRPRVLLRRLWAAPATAIGLALAGIACLLGATARVEQGVLEVAGGRLASSLRFLPKAMRILAITFGHVVLGVSHSVLAQERIHEHAHVRQYERWGVLFFPLYLGSSGAQLVRGRHPYHDNAFERQACQAAASREDRLGTPRQFRIRV
jgi:hypothetical protein